MTFCSRHRRRAGFTLIELLTVVAIISLLIGILLPSLARARDQAKKAKIAGMLSSIDKALEMFYNDFHRYPDSRLRADPIVDWPDLDGTGAPANGDLLSGAHWLARALVGHDFGGVDAEGLVLREFDASGTNPTFAALATAARKDVYMDGEIFVRDNDPEQFPTAGTGDFVPTKRTVVVDEAFDSPILYYRANERAMVPFCLDGLGSNDPGNPDDVLGIYRHRDNVLITGQATTTSGQGWDFSGAGRTHEIAPFGTLDDTIHTPPAGFTNTFTNYLHSHSAHKTGGRIRPLNADTFILISAGKDGVYGTDDDITNFNRGGG